MLLDLLYGEDSNVLDMLQAIGGQIEMISQAAA
jgi:hypothetical protein